MNKLHPEGLKLPSVIWPTPAFSTTSAAQAAPTA